MATAPGDLDLAAEAALVRFVWKAAPVLTLAHDVSDGGLEQALREAAEHSGVEAARRAAGAGHGRAGAARLRARERRAPRHQGPAAHRDGQLMCGLFGIRSPERDVARLTYFGLFALQHRGQESAGIAVSDGGRLTTLRDMGLVTQVFDEQKLRGLRGELAIGHTRYSTTGSSQWWNAQPLVQHGAARTIALGHNGNLTNAAELREELADGGHSLATTADTEVIAALIANDPAPLADAVASAMQQARRRVLRRRAERGQADRVPRPARHAPALSRPPRQRLGRRVGDRARSTSSAPSSSARCDPASCS